MGPDENSIPSGSDENHTGNIGKREKSDGGKDVDGKRGGKEELFIKTERNIHIKFMRKLEIDFVISKEI